MKVLTHSTPVALWHEIIHEAEAACETTLEHEIEAYLVFLLARYIDKPEIVKKVMAVELLEALHTRALGRDVALQSVGDTCLLFSGLFPQQAAKRQVKISYFIKLGQGAYWSISKDSNDLYGSLSRQFVNIMDILQSIRNIQPDCPDLLPFEAYDLWNESGSKRALKLLKQYSRVGSAPVFHNEQDIFKK